jgi:Xaa-Pro aminopeptidase
MSVKPGPLTLSDEDRRILAPWVADCVERALPSFERVAASDLRPRLAVEGLRAFARSERQVGALRRLALEAHAAARAVKEPAAVAAARAAGQAAGVAHMAGHALPAAAYAVKAVSVDTTDPEMAASAEVQWQFRATSASVRSILRRLPRQQGPAGGAFGATAQLLDLIANDD